MPSAAAAENPYAIVARRPREGVRGRAGARRFRAVDDVSFRVRRGTTHALVGESGSGKTTTARLVTRFLHPDAGTHRAGRHGCRGPARARPAAAAAHASSCVYQNPFSSLDPRQSVEQIIAEPLHNFGEGTRAERRARAAELVDRVALPADVLAALAARAVGRPAPAGRDRARARRSTPRSSCSTRPCRPSTSPCRRGSSSCSSRCSRSSASRYLFISHDLAVVRRISHTVSVMRRGRVVEAGSDRGPLHPPRHTTTRASCWQPCPDERRSLA